MIDTSKQKKLSASLCGPDPLYQRIKAQIITKIRSDEWPPGHRIPSENKLVGELSV